MSEKWKDELTDQLSSSLPQLSTREEAYQYLEDLATIAEIKAMAQRLEVAKLLLQGYTYPKIVEETGASTATISSAASERPRPASALEVMAAT